MAIAWRGCVVGVLGVEVAGDGERTSRGGLEKRGSLSGGAAGIWPSVRSRDVVRRDGRGGCGAGVVRLEREEEVVVACGGAETGAAGAGEAVEGTRVR
jgi:hypothetical protein